MEIVIGIVVVLVSLYIVTKIAQASAQSKVQKAARSDPMGRLLFEIIEAPDSYDGSASSKATAEQEFVTLNNAYGPLKSSARDFERHLV